MGGRWSVKKSINSKWLPISACGIFRENRELVDFLEEVDAEKIRLENEKDDVEKDFEEMREFLEAAQKELQEYQV